MTDPTLGDVPARPCSLCRPTPHQEALAATIGGVVAVVLIGVAVAVVVGAFYLAGWRP